MDSVGPEAANIGLLEKAPIRYYLDSRACLSQYCGVLSRLCIEIYEAGAKNEALLRLRYSGAVLTALVCVVSLTFSEASKTLIRYDHRKNEELTKLQSRSAELQAEIAREHTAALAALPAQYGFSTLESLIKALKAAAGKRASVAKQSSQPLAKKAAPSAVITPEMKVKVVELAKAEKTGAEIARAVGISLPSVQHIKRRRGW